MTGRFRKKLVKDMMWALKRHTKTRYSKHFKNLDGVIYPHFETGFEEVVPFLYIGDAASDSWDWKYTIEMEKFDWITLFDDHDRVLAAGLFNREWSEEKKCNEYTIIDPFLKTKNKGKAAYFPLFQFFKDKRHVKCHVTKLVDRGPSRFRREREAKMWRGLMDGIPAAKGLF